MRSQIGGPKAMPPVDLRRLAGGFHSVAKQVSFKTPFFHVPPGFWSDFGRFWEAKIDAKIDFWAVFFRCFFGCNLTSILDGFFEARNLKNL